MPKVVDASQKRAELVEASWRVIAEEGLNGATLKRVAETAGCTTGALTHYFEDRDALLIEALRRAHYQAGARMMHAAAHARSDAKRLRDVLLQALPLDDERLREWKVWLAFWGAAAGDEALSLENARRYDEWRELLETLLAPVTRNGREMRAEATWLMALIDGLGLRLALLHKDAVDLQTARGECCAQVERALGRLREGAR